MSSLSKLESSEAKPIYPEMAKDQGEEFGDENSSTPFGAYPQATLLQGRFIQILTPITEVGETTISPSLPLIFKRVLGVNASELQDLITTCPNLQHLELQDCPAWIQIDGLLPLQRLQNLRSLQIKSSGFLAPLNSNMLWEIAQLRLSELCIEDDGGLQGSFSRAFQLLGKSPTLTKLQIIRFSRIKDEDFCGFSALSDLTIDNCYNIHGTFPNYLANPERIEVLKVLGHRKLKDLSAFAKLSQLRKLDLIQPSENFDFLKDLHHLEYKRFWGQSAQEDGKREDE